MFTTKGIITKQFISVIILLHAIFFIIAVWIRGIYTLDSPEYLLTAENLINNCTFYNGTMDGTLNPTLYTLRPPGYPVFIALCKLIVNSDITIILLQNILSIILCIYLYKESRKISDSMSSGIMITSGLIMFPVYLILVNMVMAESLLAVLLLSALILIKRYLENHKWHYLLLFNFVLALSVLTKPVMMYFWIPNLLFSIYLLWKYRQIYILTFSLILPLVIGLWSYRNYKTTGFFEYSSIKTQNLLELNAGSIISFLENHDEMKQHREAILLSSKSYSEYGERSAYLMNEAKSVIYEHPVLYMYLHLKGMVNFLLAPGRIDIEIFFNIRQKNDISLLYEIEKRGFNNGLTYYAKNVNSPLIITTFFIFCWNIVLMLFLFFSFFSKKLTMEQKAAIFMLVFYIVFASGPGGYARFKVALFPVFLYMLPYGVDVIKNFRNYKIPLLQNKS